VTTARREAQTKYRIFCCEKGRRGSINSLILKLVTFEESRLHVFLGYHASVNAQTWGPAAHRTIIALV
jgi:hypothetical protein